MKYKILKVGKVKRYKDGGIEISDWHFDAHGIEINNNKIHNNTFSGYTIGQLSRIAFWHKVKRFLGIK